MTSEVTARVGDQRPGGRASRVRSAVLRAAAERLTEVGYDALTYDDVARRADVHKTTVYRRWPSKPGLVADAVGLHSEENVPIPDTGSLTTDLEALAGAVAANIGSVGGARRSRSIVAAATVSDELADALHQFMRSRITLAEPVVARAIERGELPTGTDPHVVVEALVAPIWFRLLLTGEPLDDHFLEPLCNLVRVGAGAT
jgi:AcrR family transcriptional regulator